MRCDEALSAGPPSTLIKLRDNKQQKAHECKEKPTHGSDVPHCNACVMSLSHEFGEFGDKVMKKGSFLQCPPAGVLEALVHVVSLRLVHQNYFRGILTGKSTPRR